MSLGWCKAYEWRVVYVFWDVSHPSVSHTIFHKNTTNSARIGQQHRTRGARVRRQRVSCVMSTMQPDVQWRSLAWPAVRRISPLRVRLPLLILKQYSAWLCRNKHPCSASCSAGICEIQTKPHAIEATFVGTHSTFEYTRVSSCLYNAQL